MIITYITPFYRESIDSFQLALLSSYLLEIGIDCNIVASTIYSKNIFINEVPIYRLKTINLAPNFLNVNYPYLLGIKDILETIKPDVIHIQSHLFFSNYRSVLLANKLNIPVLLSVHGFNVNRNVVINNIQNIYLNTIGKDILKRSSLIHCLNKAEFNKINKLYKNEKTIIIPNGVDTNFFHSNKIKKDNVLIWSGRMVKEKGLFILLKAMKEVIKYRSDIVLWLAGDGPEKDALFEYVITNGLKNNVIFLGWKSKEELSSILSQTRYFINSSFSEGMPYSILEAMSAGNLVIVSDIPQLKELVTDNVNGLIFPTGNSDALAKKIIQIVSDVDLSKKLSGNARKTVIKKHSIKDVYNKYINLYNYLIK